MITCPPDLPDLLGSSRDNDELLSRIRSAVARTPWPSAPPHPSLPAIDGFRVIRSIAEGGMGRIYEAEQLRPSRRVAIKLLRCGRDSTERRLLLFHREADALARLNHPDVAAVYSAGLSRSGEPFLAMEFVEGVTLDEHASLHPPGVDDALRLVARICRAAHHAHERQVIHRDLKPSNIMVDRHGNPKILDFGLARIAAGHYSRAARVTIDGRIAGTLAYMSPEQACARAGAVDARADVYALGVILYELLTGALPVSVHNRNVAQVIDAIRTETPYPPRCLRPELHMSVDQIILRALRKRPDDRYQSALAFAEDIERYLDALPLVTTSHAAGRRRWRPVAAAIASITLATGTLGTDAGSIPQPPPLPPSAVGSETVHLLGPTITLVGDLQDLEQTLRTRLRVLGASPNVSGPDRRGTLVRLALVLEQQRRYADAEECFRDALAEGRAGLQRRLFATIGLARCIGAQGRHDEANKHFSECHRMVGRLGPYEQAVRIELTVAVARDRLAQRRFTDARRFLDRAAALRDTAPLTAQWSRWSIATAYADYSAAIGDASAEQHWRLRAAAAFSFPSPPQLR